MRVLHLVFLIATVAFMLLAHPAAAWWCLGHMATAEIAKSQMSPAVIDYVETAVASLREMGPFPESADMAQVACWADDVKTIKLGMMGEWHFIDQPYNPQNVPIPGSPVQNENVAKVISQLYQGISANKRNPKGWAMGFAIGNLIHFVGDIHQPLHATELFSAEFPTGDAGGNTETVYIDGTTQNLHKIWDSICWKFSGDMKRPLNAADTQTLKNYADYLLQTYKFNDSQISTHDPMVMAKESYDAAVSTAYPNITNGCQITKQYLAKCLPVAEQRVALGGLRLGKQLQSLLGSFAEEVAINRKKGIFAIDHDREVAVLNKTKEFIMGFKQQVASRRRKVS